MKARIAHIFGETPILFIGTVLVIAITFRVGIGAVKSASGVSADAAQALNETPVVHTPVAPAKAQEKAVAPAVATPVVQAEPTPPAMPEPVKPLAKRKTPRIHGKR